MVVITAGFGLFALPFYPKRCIVCGIEKSSVVDWYRTWAWIPLGVLVVMAMLVFSTFLLILIRRPPPQLH
jgi:hypothetical protein